jgi:TonB family protein
MADGARLVPLTRPDRTARPSSRGQEAGQGQANLALEGLLDACGVGIYVLSADAALVSAIHEVCSMHPAINVVSEWAALRKAIDAGRCGIVLLDMDCAGAARDKYLGVLSRHAARPVVVAAGSISDAPDLMRTLDQRRIHRLLIKPASPGQVRLLLEAAIRRRLVLRDPDDGPVEPCARYGGIASRRPPPSRRRLAGLALAMLAVFAAVVAVGLGWHERAPGPPAGVPQGDAAALAPPLETHAVAPAADSEAGEASPVEPAPADPLAAPLAAAPAELEGLFTGIEQALLAGELDAAAADLAQVRELWPESVRLTFLETQLEAARTRQQAEAEAREAAARARPAPRPPPPRELDVLLARAQGHLEQGELVRPEAGNAFGLFERAAAMAPNDRRVNGLREQLRGAVLVALLQSLDTGATGPAGDLLVALRGLRPEAAVLAELEGRYRALRQGELMGMLEDALDAGRWGVAESALDGLRALDVEPALLASLAAELAVMQRQAELLAAVVPAGTLELLESQPPAYPASARRAGIEGWVELEFTVGRDGRPQEVTVTGAEPAGRFEQAALDAVAGYRYAPVVIDEVAYARRVSLRMRFALQ